MLRLALVVGVFAVALWGAARPACAQPTPSPDGPPTIRLEAEDTPLAEVLRQLSAQAGIDVVFAERTVAGRAVSGRYVGDDAEGALRTVLRSSGLRAERVRPRQYVIVAEPPALPDYDDDPFPAVRVALTGTVVDGETGEVLPGAHVILVGLDLGAVTNAAGYFALPGLPAGLYRVRATYVGYRAFEGDLPVGPLAERPVLRLFPQPVASAPVVVEGADGERSDLQVVPGTARVGVRQAAALPALLGEGDLAGALEWLPGVTRTGEAGGELVVRGAEAQYNRYLLDGAPVIHPWHAFGLFSVFQPEALKTVRLHRGSLPAEYGVGLSAVLDLEMRDGERQRPSGVVALSPISARAVVEAPVSNALSLMVSARRTWLDLLLQPQLRLGSAGGLPSIGFEAPRWPGNGDGGQDVGYHFFDLNAKLTWRLADGHRLSVSAYEGGDRLSAVAPFTALAEGLRTASAEAGEDPLALELGYRWGNRLLSARYRGLIGRAVFVTATGYVSSYGAREEVLARPTAAAAIASDYRVRFTEGGLRLDADYYHSLEHQVRVGLRLVGRDFSGRLTQEQRRSERLVEWREEQETVRVLEAVAYVQDTWQPAPGWQIQPGLRVEAFGLGPYLSVNPRFHLRRTLLRDRLFLRAGLGRQTQPLHRVRDRYAFTYDLASDRWLPASDRVRPASAWQAASGLEWVPRPGLALSAEAFARRLADILLPADPYQQKNGLDGPGIAPGALLDQYRPGAGRAAGLELTAEAERGRWRGGLSYTLSRTEERVPGEPYRPARYDAPHQAEAFLLGGLGSWTLSATAVLRSGYPLSVPTARYGLSDPLDPDDTEYLHRPALHNGRLPAYARVDLAVGYAFRVAGLAFDAQAQAYNLLNRRNTVGQQFGQEAGLVPTPVAGLPILPMVGLRARW